ncbi:FAD binding domain protein [Diaporthe sp. PMI_573]|nr:FAD binding domain protein [Diaporthaceae sp. PMI_573]
MAQAKGFKIIIAGGGIAGLTLAAILEKFDIDYVLLESHGNIAPEVGASIGLFPNGLRILDQIGCYEDIRALPESNVRQMHIADENGKTISISTDTMPHFEQRLGYRSIFFDRQWLLRILYDHLVHKDRVKLNKKVFQIKLVPGGVEALTKDGDSFKGSIVVGADGIYSTVRAEMFRLASEIQPDHLDPKELDKVPCYYKCSFGIAKDVPGWNYEHLYMVQSDGASQMLISGPNGRLYWFFFSRLPETKYGNSIPKYTQEDEAQFVKENAHRHITETITFGQVYERRISSTLTPLHEDVKEKWYFRRIFILGDAAHKPNPIGGQGGRGGNLDNISDKEIEEVFSRILDIRHERAKNFVKTAHETQSLMAREKPLLTKILMRLDKIKGLDAGIDRLGAICRPAVRIDKLPIPKRPRAIPYDDELPARPIRSKANFLLQLLIVGAMVFLLAISVLTLRIPFERPAIWGRDGPKVDRVWFSGAPALNEFTNFIVSAFSLQVGVPDVGPKIHTANFFLGQLTSFVLIWVIESYRAGNKGTLISLPIIPLSLMQVQGIFRMAPLYVILAIFEGFDLSPGRFVRPAVAKSLIPALVLGYIVPTILMLLPTSNIHALQTYCAIWQPSPAFVAVLVSVFSRGRLEDPDLPIEQSLERYKNPDVPILQAAYSVLFWIQATAHISTFIYTYYHPDLTISQLFFDLQNPFEADWGITDPVTAMMAFLQYDYVVSTAALIVYELFSIWKLRQMGYVTTTRAAVAVLGLAAGQLTVGPGAAWAALWSWRESVLANVAPVR